MKEREKSIMPAKISFYLGLVAIGIGVTLVTFNEFTLNTLIIIVGGILASGGLGIFIFRMKKKCKSKTMQILQIIGSILNILFGLSLAFFPEFYHGLTIIIMGIAIIMGGITMLITSLSFSPLTNASKVFIAISIAMIIAGSIFIFNPFKTAEAISIFLGIIFIIFGIANIIMSFWIRKNLSSIKNKASELIDSMEQTNNSSDKTTIETEATVIEDETKTDD
jgi:uncharacterized membrane protein HdeD (DUF308 family)